MVQEFRQAGFMVDLNSDHSATLNKKIRWAQLSQHNYIFGKDLQPELRTPGALGGGGTRTL